MAAAAIIGGLAGLAGTVAGMPGGYSTSSTSLLDPMQQLQMMGIINSAMPHISGHYSTLNALGQNSPNAYNSLNNFSKDYRNDVWTQQKTRQRDQSRSLGDPWHSQSTAKTRQNFNTQANLETNSLRNQLMKQDLFLKNTGANNEANRQLDYLDTMSSTWMAPMGKTRENYMTQSNTKDYIVGGLTGLQGLTNMASNLSDYANGLGQVSAGLGR